MYSIECFLITIQAPYLAESAPKNPQNGGKISGLILSSVYYSSYSPKLTACLCIAFGRLDIVTFAFIWSISGAIVMILLIYPLIYLIII